MNVEYDQAVAVSDIRPGRGDIRVGIAQARNQTRPLFGEIPMDGVTRVRERFVPVHNRFRRVPVLGSLLQGVAWLWPWASCDIVHTFNTVLANRRPWVVTFEDHLPCVWLPRYAHQARRPLLELVAGRWCRKVLAMSDNALVHLRTRNAAYPALLEDILCKSIVVYPGFRDPLQGRTYRRPERGSETVRIIFVGVFFFMKGGPMAVRAFERLKNRFPLHLTVVSTMSTVNWMVPTPAGEVGRWLRRMHDAGVEYVRWLSHDDLFTRIAESDVLILPTLDDSFGYVVAEAMGAGTPVVATRVRAIPEIITHGVDGLLLDVPTTQEGRLDLTRTSLDEIEEQLVAALTTVIERPDLRRRMGESARRTFLARFTEQRLACDLRAVYTEALS